MSKKVFMIQGANVDQVDPRFRVEEKLPVGIYDIVITMFGVKLVKIADSFDFPYKIYGLQNEFINHIIKTYNNTTGNMGVLMNGTKGTGKTVSAKILANTLQLPVIILKNLGDNTSVAIDYLNTLSSDCIIFMDEFEKNFSDGDQTILQIMDGVYNSEFRKVFLLTTNELKVNENLLGRPSRIRYVKHFGNLEMSTVEEYIDENLNDKSAKQELIDFIDTLTISTIDILKSIVTEVNIHGIANFKAYRQFFNVTTESFSYTTYRGYVYRNELEKNKVTIQEFITAVEHYMNPMTPPKIKDIDNMTEEEESAWNLYQNYGSHNFHYIQYRVVDADVRFKSLKVGDKFWGENVVQVEHKKNVIVTYDPDEEQYFFYFVTNPDSKPSLYSKYASPF